MEFDFLEPVLKSRNIRTILNSRDLAQLGDFIANYIYSAVRIGKFGIPGSIHVWDKVLRDAMNMADVRKYLNKRTKPDHVADAGEALIAYAYLTKLMSTEEMLEIILNTINEDTFKSLQKEKHTCTEAFSKIFMRIIQLGKENSRFTT